MGRWTALAFGALAGAMMAFPGAAADAAWQGIVLWGRAVAPVLGPFMVCMLMLTARLGGGERLRVALGWLCGSPGGAKLMRQLALRGPEALRCAAMTGTMSPMFFLGTVSAWLRDGAAGRMIFICHVLGAALMGLCIPGTGEKRRAEPAPLALGQALKETGLALTGIALCMMLGCVAARMAACALPGLPQGAEAALQCALEVTAGVRSLIGLRTPWTAPLICAACSFGGLSLLLQNAAFWQESGVTLGQLFFLRLAHGLLSGMLCWAAAMIFGL